METCDKSEEVQILRSQATILAGNTGDLIQRATVYHHLYSHSGGNHSFPLLAAHGALWASGYFRKGMMFGALIALVRSLKGDDRAALMQRLSSFAEDFRDINRRVCVETFFIYWLTGRIHLLNEAERIVPQDLFDAMDRCHAARRVGRTLSSIERRELFRSFFLWEQSNIVGPSIEKAFAEFDWKLIHQMALRPTIRFSYFTGSPLSFVNFCDTKERISMGMAAYDRANATGWDRVEYCLGRYGIMPSEFSADPAAFFERLAQSVLPLGSQEHSYA